LNAYDLVIIGGGPAGCAAAITAARAGARVLIAEASRYPRHKVCGEFISPESLTPLRYLLNGSDLLVTAPQLHRARIFVLSQVIQASLNPPAASISRLDLDLALWNSAVSAGCDAQQQVVIRSIEHNQNARFLCRSSIGDFNAASVIVAAGRWSHFAKRIEDAERSKPTWLGIKAHCAEACPDPSVDLYLFKGGYCGVQPAGTGRVNVCAVVRSDVATTLDRILQLHPALRSRSLSWHQTMEPVTTAPLIFSAPVPVRGEALYVGDAAGFVDPFVGDGISLALQSGIAAAAALAPAWQDHGTLTQAAERYRQEYATRFAPVFRNAAKVRRLLSLPAPVQYVVGAVLRLPAVSARVIKSTRTRT